MPGIARQLYDVAGGPITGGSPNVFANTKPVARIGDSVMSHGLDPHSSPVMSGHSVNVFANDIEVSRAADAASCTCTSTGSPNVFVNG